jgi:hypothetical protein
MPRDILHPQKLTLTSQKCCGRSVGVVRSRTNATELLLLLLLLLLVIIINNGFAAFLLGFVRFFSFLILYAVGGTPWTVHSLSLGLYLVTCNMNTERNGIPTPVSERTKTVHALVSVTTLNYYLYICRTTNFYFTHDQKFDNNVLTLYHYHIHYNLL